MKATSTNQGRNHLLRRGDAVEELVIEFRVRDIQLEDDLASGASAEQTLVLLDNNETGGYNPVAGYSRSGDSPGFVEVSPDTGLSRKRPS